jgi:thioesterase domain-containing protein
MTSATVSQNPSADRQPDAASTAVLVPIRRQGGRPPLFAFSAGHGDVLSLGALCRRLSPDQPVYVLQPPSRRWLGPARGKDLARRIAAYVEAIASVRPTGPYRLLGNSSAGVLAVETARALIARGERVEMVGLLDSPLRTTWQNRLAAFVVPPVMSRLPQSKRLPRWLHAARGTARDAGFSDTVGALRGHRLAPIDAPLVLFAAELTWSIDGLLLGGFDVDIPRWRAVAAAGLVVEVVPGSHSHIMLGPNSAVLLERLDARLAALSTEAP